MKQIKLDEDIKQYIRIFVLVVLIIFFQCETNSLFLSSLNLSHIGMQNYHLFFLSIGMFFVIITNNVDLSIGVVASLISGLSAMFMIENRIPVFSAVMICVIIGAFIGAIQGFVVEKFKIPSLLVTLIGLIMVSLMYGVLKIKTLAQFPKAFESIFSGFMPNLAVGGIYNLTVVLIGIIFTVMYVTFKISERNVLIKYNNNKVKPMALTILNVITISIVINLYLYFSSKSRGVSYILVLLAVIIFLYSIVSIKTSAMRALIIADETIKAERLTTIKSNHVILFAFINMGILSAIAGLFLTARLNYTISIMDTSILYDTILACYIGGASIRRGSGTLRGVIVGCMIIAVIYNGLVLLGWSMILWDNLKFLILIIVVILDIRNKHMD